MKVAEMLARIPVLVAWLVVGLPLAASQGHAQVQDCDAVSSGVAQAVRFAAARQDGATVRLDGVLHRPAGEGPFAALIVLHGFGGIAPPPCYEAGIGDLTDWGYVTLLIDSASQTDPAGVTITEYSTTDQARHVRGAKDFLSTLPYVDADRIGLVGWSQGGLATIRAVASADISGRPGPPIRAAAAIYPICPPETRRIAVPLLIVIGERDHIVSLAACRRFKADVLTGNVELVTYPRADHMFDVPRSTAYRPATRADAFARIRRHLGAYLHPERR